MSWFKQYFLLKQISYNLWTGLEHFMLCKIELLCWILMTLQFWNFLALSENAFKLTSTNHTPRQHSYTLEIQILRHERRCKAILWFSTCILQITDRNKCIDFETYKQIMIHSNLYWFYLAPNLIAATIIHSFNFFLEFEASQLGKPHRSISP